MNAYAVRAQEWLSEIASRADWDYDRSHPIELARKASGALAKRAVAIRGATEKTFAATGASCVTSGSPDDDVDAAELRCYTDQPQNDPESTPFTSATAASLASFASIPGSAGVLQLVPFLKARNGRRGPGHGMETSGWMTGFMLEGLYAAAGDLQLEGGDAAAVVAAVDYAHSTLTNQGNNSWLGMIRQNATMTMEVAAATFLGLGNSRFCPQKCFALYSRGRSRRSSPRAVARSHTRGRLLRRGLSHAS